MHTTQDRYHIAAQEDRCSPRTRLTIPGQLRASGGRAFQTVVHDLSISGFSAASINRMHEGQLCRSEEHTSELQSLMRISYAVFCLKTKKIIIQYYTS